MPPSIDRLLPHRAPMQWIDALIDCTDTTARATTCFSAGHFAVADGQVIEAVFVECIAQTVAAGLAKRREGQEGKSQKSEIGANLGMLAAVANFRIQSSAPAGRP